MDLTTLVLARTAATEDVRQVMDAIRINRRIDRRADRRAGRRVEALEDEVSFLALTLLSLVAGLVEKGVLTEDELRERLKRLDGADGIVDGKLSPDALRGALGLPREPTPEPEAPRPSTRRRKRPPC